MTQAVGIAHRHGVTEGLVDDAQQRLPLGRVREEAQRREGDQEPVGAVPRFQSEGDVEGAPPGAGE
ncbi:MAG: hypothetical protein QOG45_2559 [Chloroflexota bacterium]|nr:hypothetical protein [Chloroflexota bacterium]